MTEAAMIAMIGIIPTTLAASTAAVIGILNRNTIKKVETNVDGNLTEVKNQLAIAIANIARMTEALGIAQGVAEEKERNRLAGDAKYAEGVEAEKSRHPAS